MRKITIVEVFDPIKTQYVPIRQAINQGLFNTKTYLFFDPIHNRHYSITEAAQRGLFKSAIDLRPEALIVERVKIAQTVILLSARDPDNLNRLVDIKEAIELGIVDTNLRIYRNTNTNEVCDLGDAIDRNLVQVKIAKETTEKITETVTEQKTSNNLGLVKKIETSSKSTNGLSNNDEDNENLPDIENHIEDDEDDKAIKNINGNYIFDRTKSLNINKRMQTMNDDITAGFISDVDSRKILDQSSKNNSLKSILKSDPRSLSPIIDFNEAILKNVIILPDSLMLTQSVQYVIDLSTNNKIEFDDACNRGIIDVRNKRFIDTRDRTSMSLFEALKKKYIIMNDELNNNYEDKDDEKMLPKSTVTTSTNLKNPTHNDILSVFNPISGIQVSLIKAMDSGIYDKQRNLYIDLLTKKSLPLKQAVERGMVVLKTNMINKENEDYEFLNIKGIINPINNKEMALNEAIAAGFLDYAECEFHDPVSGKTYTLLDAYDKGFLITSANSNTSNTNTATSIKSSKTLTNGSLNISSHQQPQRKSRKDEIEIERQPLTSTPTNETIITKVEERKISSNPEEVESKLSTSKSNTNPPPRSLSFSTANNNTSSNRYNKASSTMPATTSQSPVRRNNPTSGAMRTQSTYDIKSSDRFSISSRKSVIRRLKEKVFGKRLKSNILNNEEIQRSLRIIDTQTKQKYSLHDAIKRNLLIPEECVVDVENNEELSVREGITKSLVKFFHPLNNFEFKYEQSCYIFGNNLFLINYVLDPKDTHRKIGLKSAFAKAALDKDNGIYYSKKGPFSLAVAIDKGYLSCEIIDLNLLSAIITSNIDKYSNYKQQANQHLKIEKPLEETKTRGALNHDDEDDDDDEQKETKPVQQSSLNASRLIELEQQRHQQLLEQQRKIESLFIPKELLKHAGFNFDEYKNYVVSEVYDATSQKFVPVKEAKTIGIYNAIDNNLHEYVDSKTGDAYNLSLAIRKGKVKIVEYDLYKRRDNSFASTASKSKSNNRADLALNTDEDDIDEMQSNISASTRELTNSSSPSTRQSEQKTKVLKSRKDMSPILKHGDDSSTRSLQTIENTSSEFAEGFNIIKSLLYKKPNGKLISFDKMIELGLYDIQTGKFNDLNNDEYVSFSDGLLKALLKINDSFVCFDEKNVYVIESILNHNRKISLIDAVNKGIIDKHYCTFNISSNSTNIPIREAMKEGLIEGKIITSNEVKWILNDYAKKMENKILLNRSTSSKIENAMKAKSNANTDNDEDDDVDEDTKSIKSKTTSISSTKQRQQMKKNISLNEIKSVAGTIGAGYERSLSSLSKYKLDSDDYLSKLQNLQNGSSTLEAFTEYFVYDAEVELYVSLNDAFYNGIVLTEPVRIRDPTTGSYILLKDAAIKGLISTQKTDVEGGEEPVDFKNRSTFVTFDRVSYIIDYIYGPRKKVRYSCQEAVKKGLFVNGIYKNTAKQESLHIDEAILNGYVIGRKVDLQKMEEIFKTWLTLPPSKPTRGVFIENKQITKQKQTKSKSTNNFQEQADETLEDKSFSSTTTSTSKTKMLRRKQKSEETVLRSNIEPLSAKIVSVKDVASGRFLKLNEAEMTGIINFNKGIFINSSNKQIMQINDAINKGLILLDKQHGHSENVINSTNGANRIRSLSNKSKQTSGSLDDDELDNNQQNDYTDNRIEMGQQFSIVSITDLLTKNSYDLESAIKLGIFEIDSAMYVDKTKDNQKLTLVEAIDQGLVKINDQNFKSSYKLEVERADKRNLTNRKVTYSIRYVVDPITKDIIPVNVAFSKKLVDLDDGYYVGHNKLTLKEAYDNCLVFTKEDLDDPESKRARFNVLLARKSTNGKNMSVKSALAKNWINIGRRIYIDKQTYQDMPFSMAVDMDLLVLRHVDINDINLSSRKADNSGSTNNVHARLVR